MTDTKIWGSYLELQLISFNWRFPIHQPCIFPVGSGHDKAADDGREYATSIGDHSRGDFSTYGFLTSGHPTNGECVPSAVAQVGLISGDGVMRVMFENFRADCGLFFFWFRGEKQTWRVGEFAEMQPVLDKVLRWLVMAGDGHSMPFFWATPAGVEESVVQKIDSQKGMVFSVVGLVAVLRRLRHAWRRTRLLCPRMSEVWASSLTHCHFLQFPPKLLSFDPSKILHAISWEVVLRWLRFTVPLRAGECGQLAESHHRLVGQIVRWKHFHPNLWKIELLLPGKLSWTLIMMVSNRNLRISRGWKFSGEVSAVGFRGWRSETIKAGSLHFVWLWLFDHW